MNQCFFAAAFCYVLALASCGHPAFAFTTVDDLESGRFAEAPVISQSTQSQAVTNQGDIINISPPSYDPAIIIDVPLNSTTSCSMVGGYGSCSNREIKPDPTECPAGQSLITLRKYGYVSHVCARD